MDRRDTSLRDHRFPSRRDLESTPSFSSTLLDAIYRSIDQGCDGASEDMLLYNYNEKPNRTGFEDDHEEMAKLRRACLIEKWMEKKVNDKVVRRGISVPDFQRKARSNDSRESLWLSHSSSTSSDSSSGSGFSSSEAESGYKPSSTKPKSMILRTSVSVQPEKFNKQMSSRGQKDFSKAKHENGYANNTKSKAAMKIYNDFKKSKQPLSPGGRLTSFLNSLFTTASTKKTKISKSAGDHQREEMAAKTKCDPKLITRESASSFSRSCLSKTQSSRGKLSSSNVPDSRSVKFCPVNIIVDEYYDQLPSGPKDVDITMPSFESMKHHDIRNSMREELKLKILERNRRVEEVARDLGQKCHKSVYVKQETDVRNEHRAGNNGIADDTEEEDDDDDAASYASSDLFELDSLSAIGMDEELPVYETTQHLNTNRAIPNGMIL